MAFTDQQPSVVAIVTEMQHHDKEPNVNTSYVSEVIRAANHDKVMLILPVIIYVFFSVVVGLIGNSLVCYIYNFRLRRSPSRFFILFLALLDLVSCIFGAASELSDLFQPFTFKTTWSCKILRFVLSFTIISASFTLICVAFDRYYKVCKPLKAFPVKKVKILCILVGLFGIVLSVPALAIFGLKTAQTGILAINGTECSTADNMRGTPLPIVYYVVLFAAFLVLFTSFIMLYVRIGIEIYKRKRLTIGETLPALIKTTSNGRNSKFARNDSVLVTDETSGPSGQTDEESRGYCDNQAMTEAEAGNQSANRTTFTFVRRRSKMGRMSIRTIRTTSIFFAVSVAFVLSFLPYLIANLLKFSKLAFHKFDHPAEEVVYNFCVRSYFISNFINPIIYSALNLNFRKECYNLFKRILERIKHCCCYCCLRESRDTN